ncbi:uncharacterized protein TRAVEDRAFT_17336 [Trametes versicolor FP-101664 SS1]|uniref:uncharacterized protein n=1 Tax=Trametes versicolor (strain FP-101664) TaxID=717944 RepID=UPI0004622DD6|nr:uncharacterized protein TRAVEDRAFT_17336 [Trametes versicolor FP-101664 SS1]EIW62770.1 hypothetical protein TRAVEDRAFT_17336 [Trametes versicolor FP-101664 SS1]
MNEGVAIVTCYGNSRELDLLQKPASHARLTLHSHLHLSAQRPSTKKVKTKLTTDTTETSQNPPLARKIVTGVGTPTPSSLPPKAVKRKGALPKIDVDKPDTPEPEGGNRLGANGRQSQLTGPPPRQQDAEYDREEHVNEDGEDINPDTPASGDSENEDDNDTPELHDEGDLNIGGEAVIFTRVPSASTNLSPASRDVTSHQRASFQDKRTPQTPSSSSSAPVSPGLVRAATSKKTQRERKLEEEMPTISAGKPLIAKPSGYIRVSEQSEEGANSDDDEPAVAWLLHTDITRALKRKSENRFGINIKKCPDEVQEVLRASFDRGMILLAFGDGTVYPDIAVLQSESFVTPFEMQGIERISLDALITAAETLGFDDIKKAAASAYPPAAQLAKLSRDAVSNLLESSNFLYPKLPSGDYQYTQPFAGLGLADVVKSAFFGNTHPCRVGSQNIGMLTLSLPTAPHELEIPDHMLAMAAAAINSVLVDQVHPQLTKSRTTEFAGSTLRNAYKAYMIILVNMHITKPLRYHALMHGICMTATGGHAITLHGHAAQNDILANVDWENIAD